MIIKSLSRKTESHEQLVRYIFHDKKGIVDERQFTILHRIQSHFRKDKKEEHEQSLTDIANEFVENLKFTKQRKNGVTMYHEILSFDKNVRDEITRESLESITQKYIEERADNALIVARPHFDEDHIHVHLMISPNEERSAKRVRMSIKEFEACKQNTREYQRERYPQLSPEVPLQLNQKQYKDYWCGEDKKYQMKRAGKSISEKSVISEQLIELLNVSNSIKQLENLLEIKGIKSYRRKGKATGVMIGKRKYRYTTLLDKESHLKTKVINLVNIDLGIKSRERERMRSKERDIER